MLLHVLSTRIRHWNCIKKPPYSTGRGSGVIVFYLFLFTGKVSGDGCLAEIHRMKELPEIHRRVYDVPFKLPSDVRRQIARDKEEQETGLKTEVRDERNFLYQWWVCWGWSEGKGSGGFILSSNVRKQIPRDKEEQKTWLKTQVGDKNFMYQWWVCVRDGVHGGRGSGGFILSSKVKKTDFKGQGGTENLAQDTGRW